MTLQEDINYHFLDSQGIALFVFAIGYITRALGGVYFAIIARNNSNLYSISIATSIMLICTFFIGCLPSNYYISFYGIFILRMIQGFALGGVMSLSIITLFEYISDNVWYYNRGILASLPIASVPLGILLADYIVYFCSVYFSEYTDMYWRIPFFISIVGCVFSSQLFFASTKRLGLGINKDDVEFIIESISLSRISVLLTICIAGINGVGFYFITSYLIPEMLNDYAVIFYCLIAICCMIGGCIFFYTEHIVYYIIALFLSSSLIFIYSYLYELSYLMHISSIVMIISVSTYIGLEGSLNNSLYDKRYCRIAFAFAYNFAMFIFGGTTPLVTKCLFNNQYIMYFGLYIVFICILALIALYVRKRIIRERNDESIR